MNARIVILETDSETWPETVDEVEPIRLQTPAEIDEALDLDENTLWVARNPALFHDYIGRGHGRHWRRLLLLGSAPRIRLEYLRQLFTAVVAPGDDIGLLPEDQLFAVLAEEHPEDYFVGAGYNEDDDAVVAYRGDLRTVTVPLDELEPNPRNKPDPTDLEIVDWGQTLRLGDFQVPADAILYERDPDFRRRRRARRREFDDSFGGSIRRLRKQRGLTQQEIPGVSSKTVGRIERNEVENPREDTLRKLADALDVDPERLDWH